MIRDWRFPAGIGANRLGWISLAGIALLALLAPPLLLPLLAVLVLALSLAGRRFPVEGGVPSPVPAPVCPLAPRAPPRG